MNKTEIQSRIEKCESREAYLQREHDALKSEIASLKADFAKCEEGIEQEKCWSALDSDGAVCTSQQRDRLELFKWCGKSNEYRPAYMPECRQVTANDVRAVFQIEDGTISHDEFAKRAHKLGFRMKVTP